MTKGMTFHMDEELRCRLKMAVAYRKETIKAVLSQLVQDYVSETEAMMAKPKTVRKRSNK